jgi:geranylgeranyl diphosphate synthase, type I
MGATTLTDISEIGVKVDPIVIKTLIQASSAEFRPALTYHFAVGGKRMRAAMVILSCRATGGRMEDALKPAAVVEFIHNYSLVMDDLIDHGTIRRGKPTVRAKFGDSTSLLAAMLYREVLDDLIEEGPRRQAIREIAVRAMKEIIDGERLDLQFEQGGRDEPFLVGHRIREASLELYLQMIGKKTASLFQAAGEIGAHSAKAGPTEVSALGHYGWKAGLAFQIIDDVLDICGRDTGKEAAKDVIEHKLGNAAILTALKYLPGKDRRELMTILGAPKVSVSMARRAQRLVAKTPAERECREIASQFVREATESLSVLRPSTYRDGLLELADRVLSRTR